MRTLLTTILQIMIRPSDITKYIYPYVFMTGNDDNVDEEQATKMIWTTTTTTNKKEQQ